jgi:germination protein M
VIGKRTAAALLCAAMTLLPGCAAGNSPDTSNGEYLLYYEVRDLSSARGGDAVAAEDAAFGQNDDAAQKTAIHLMGRLLAGPEDKTLESPFPNGTELRSLSLDGSRAVVDLSAAYGALSGAALTMADYCITMTLTQIPDINTVSITVLGQELAYRDRHVFTNSDVLRSSMEDVVGTVDVLLYFPDASGALTGEKRTLELYEGDTQTATVIRALREGPERKNLSAALPENFVVHSVWMEDDLCYVNLFASALEQIPTDAARSTAIRALTRSLCSLNAVNGVRYLVDGEQVDHCCGVDLSGVKD